MKGRGIVIFLEIILTTILILNSLREFKFTCFLGPLVVAASGITVTATESSRRLSEARKLAGSWSIAYSFTVPTSQAAAVH